MVPREVVLYQQGFEAGVPAGWELQTGWGLARDADGNWVLRAQEYSWARYIQGRWADYTLKLRVKLVRGLIHLNYRTSGCTRYFIRFSEGDIALNKTSPCDNHPQLRSLSEAHTPGRWYEVKIVGTGGKLDIYVDGVLKLTYTDPDALLAGFFAFESLDGSEAYGDDIVVLGLEMPPGLRWVKTGGPLGGLGYDIRMRQDNPDVLYVTDAYSGVNKSVDGSRTWSAVNEGIITRTGASGDAIPIFSLTVSPHNPDVIWAGTTGFRGIYRSTDGGKTWVKKDSGVVEDEGITFRGFTIDPRNPNTVYAAAELSSWAWAGESRQGKEFDRTQGVVYRTTDNGEHWTAIWRGDNMARYVWIDPRNSSVIYVSTGLFDREAANSDPATNSPGGVGIVKSTDGGRTWRALGRSNGLTNLYIGTLFMHPQNPDILLAGAGNNAYREGAGAFLSTDGGETWQRTLSSTNAPISSVEFSLLDPRVAYAASDESFYRSRDGGRTWQLMSGGRAQSGPPVWGPPGVRAGFPIDFQVDPRNADRIFANEYGGGNFLSEDGGRTWVVASQGYTGAEMRGIAVDPAAPDRIYAISRSGIFRSDSRGDAWEGLSYEPATLAEWSALALDPNNPANILVSEVGQGVILRSADGGRSWRLVFRHPQADASIDARRHGFLAISFAPSNPSVVYAGMQKLRHQEGAEPSFGVYKSTDGGLTWNPSNDSRMAGQNVNALAVHPRDPNIVYAGTIRSGVFKSTDGGQNWQPINQGLRVLDIRSLAIDPHNPQVLYAGAEGGGVYKSTNGGATWQPTSNGMDPQAAVRAIVVDPASPQVVYAGDFRTGVYRSDNGGGLWLRLNTGLRNRAVRALAISWDGSMLYAATEGEGVFRLETGGG